MEGGREGGREGQTKERERGGGKMEKKEGRSEREGEQGEI